MGRDTLDCDTRRTYEGLIVRRAAGEPVAYMLGTAHFYDLVLRVTPDVLIPRPETELLVSWALERAATRPGAVRGLDVGTGSGAVALAIAANAPNVEMIAVDISPAAVSVARGNCRELGLERRVSVVEADMLPSGQSGFDLVVANLPYVCEDDPDLDPDVRRHEPALALMAGPDGLAAIRELLERLPPVLANGADVGIEVGWRQGPAVVALARDRLEGADVSIRRDLAGHDRLVAVEGVE
jgi:release factor glutamine methyltransferase